MKKEVNEIYCQGSQGSQGRKRLVQEAEGQERRETSSLSPLARAPQFVKGHHLRK